MLKDFMTEYRQKLCTPEEAVEVVKSGDWVDYTSSLGKPVLLDRALAKRRDELFDVKIRGNLVHQNSNDPLDRTCNFKYISTLLKSICIDQRDWYGKHQ